MESLWQELCPRDSDTLEVLLKKHEHLHALTKINEGLLANFERCGQKYAHDEVADSQQTVGTAEEAGSPFRIKRKDGQSKKGALGFKPLLRSSSKPPSSAQQKGEPDSTTPRLPDRHGHGTALPPQQPLSPSAFRTPAVTRADHLFADTAQITSGVPTEKSAGTRHESDGHATQHAQEPRPWGRLALQQHGAKSALSAQLLPQQPATAQLKHQQQQSGSSHPLQEVSRNSNSSGCLASERPRGFQGKLRLKKGRSGVAAASRKAAVPTATASDQQAPRELPQPEAPAELPPGQAQDGTVEQEGERHERDGILLAVTPQAPADSSEQLPKEDVGDAVDITPDPPQWRSKRSSRVQALAHSVPAWHPAGPRRLPLVQQPLTFPSQTLGSNSADHRADGQLPPPRGPAQAPGRLGLSPQRSEGPQEHVHADRDGQSAQCQDVPTGQLQLCLQPAERPQVESSSCGPDGRVGQLQGMELAQGGSSCSSPRAGSRAAGGLGGSGSKCRLPAPTGVPETCVQDAVPDTPDCRPLRQAGSMQGPAAEASHNSDPVGQRGTVISQHASLADQANPTHQAEPLHASSGKRQHGNSLAEQGHNYSAVPDGSSSKASKHSGTASPSASRLGSQTMHGSKFYCSGAIVSAAVCSSGRCIALCVRDAGAESCSVHVWSMQQGSCTPERRLLAARGALKDGAAGPATGMQQMLAVHSSEGGVLAASSGTLQLREGAGRSVSLVRLPHSGVQHKVQSLATAQPATCVLIPSPQHLLAAGQGGHLHCWTLTHDAEEVESTYQCLPAAAYGRVTFPDIASLAYAGPGCILGCSSVGSVALWNYARGELLMARQAAGFRLHSVCCLPPACLPMLSGQPGSKRPVIALACAERRSTNSAKAGQERRLALTLLWPEQIAISMLSPTEEVTHIAAAGLYAAVALASGALQFVDLQKGAVRKQFRNLHSIRGLAAAGPTGFLILFEEHLILIDCSAGGCDSALVQNLQ